MSYIKPMTHHLPIDKCRKMLHRIQSTTNYTEMDLARMLHIRQDELERFYTGEPLPDDMQLRLIKLFCKTCK